MAKVKAQNLVDLAVRLGVIEDGPHGRLAYASWLKRDPEGAQRLVTAALPTQRAESSSAGTAQAAGRSTQPGTPAAGSGHETAYPASWRGAPARGDRRRAASASSTRAKAYPSSWTPRRSEGRSRILEVRD